MPKSTITLMPFLISDPKKNGQQDRVGSLADLGVNTTNSMMGKPFHYQTLLKPPLRPNGKITQKIPMYKKNKDKKNPPKKT
jgi:hypothetical protein